MNASDLLALRKQGKRPAGAVLATLVPEALRFHPGYVVGRSDDLAGFVGLDVFVGFASPQLESAIYLADALIQTRANSVVLWSLDTGRLVSVLENNEKTICLTLPTEGMGRLIRRIKCK